MKIIFCDVDGVLNSNNYIISLNGTFNCVEKYKQLDSEAVARLNKITDATSARIVVSSTWRIYYKRMVDLRACFGAAGITGKVIDRTPIDNNIRGVQIESWLKKSAKPIDSFIILDDDSDMGNLKENLIKTSHAEGLQDIHVGLAIELLNNGKRW